MFTIAERQIVDKFTYTKQCFNVVVESTMSHTYVNSNNNTNNYCIERKFLL